MKKIVALLLVLLIVMPVTVMALETQEVFLNGYPWFDEEDEEIAEYQVSISGVTRVEQPSEEGGMPIYYCQAPVTVKELDSLEAFYVSPLARTPDGVLIENGHYAYDGVYRPGDYWEVFIDYLMERDSDVLGEIVISEPGVYLVCGRYGAIDGGVNVLMAIEGDAVPEQQTITAKYTDSAIMVNGVPVAFEAYNINGNNYFKLRDVAQAINGTEKQFNVTWNGELNAILLERNTPYATVGGELAAGDGTDKNAVLCQSEIFEGNQKIDLTAYTINDNNYFKLRDLGKWYDFSIEWDGVNNCIMIDTTKPYTE